MRHSIVLFFALTFTFFSMAQEKGKIRYGLSLGPVTSGYNLTATGMTNRAELKYNVNDRLSVGLLFGLDFTSKDIGLSTVSSVDSSMIFQLSQGVMLTADYYFSNKTTSFAPFIGASLGSFSVFNSFYNASEPLIFLLSTVSTIIDFDFVPGAMLRTGFEYGKFRLALEYCYLPPTKYLSNSLLEFETTRNDYLSLNVGFYLGGGKWKRKNPSTNN